MHGGRLFLQHRPNHLDLSLPCGKDEAGMPFGLQVVGRFGGDVELLNISEALEQAFSGINGLSRPLPDVAALTTARPELREIVTDEPAQKWREGR